jgi:hypothetical protein
MVSLPRNSRRKVSISPAVISGAGQASLGQPSYFTGLFLYWTYPPVEAKTTAPAIGDAAEETLVKA